MVAARAVAHDERGEQLLLDLVRAEPAYQEAAICVAHYACALRKLGEEAYAEGVVHYALSRMRVDADGFVSIARLRDRLPDLSYSGALVPALHRLQSAGIVSLTSNLARPERVQLRIPL
ncbi:hypothetical protein [Polyangium jinanense]|uniref:Uncharacterized protein n=1 Tax=Polyangium jinanense TaxID=2829994 RepID=A0A9X4AZ85_9BACT|nr:hypothetical protein [Polyangium jinanense]MDC3961557.1 hypothetical protein [Polyangium jinanense]MDC3987922.1 hypothetical protein [Polyangium jinanense]